MLNAAQDLGTISATSSPVVWAVGYTRDPAINYVDLNGNQQSRSLYYKSNFTNDDDLINFFMSDFSSAQSRAAALDAKLLGAATNISSDYADIISVASRQALGAIELTTTKGSDGNFNASDTMAFLKNIGGQSARYAHSRLRFQHCKGVQN